VSVKVRGLRKAFGDRVVADDIDIDVPEGRMLVLLGPSGCGKTTTMRCIAGLETPDEGVISVGSKTVFDAAARVNTPVNRRNIGMVFQSYAIWPHMSVFDNVAFPLQMARRPAAEIRQRVEEMLSLVGLDNTSKRGASTLSGGQMQRVALARSLVMRPTLLLFDEPLSNVDARLRDQLRVLLRELQLRFGITGIYVTHDQAEAFAIADQVAVLGEGRIRQMTDPVSLYRRPVSSEIARFIGYTNVFPAQLRARDGATCTVGVGAVTLASTNPPDQAAGTFDLCIRPDAIRIQPDGGAKACNTPNNTLSGTITLVSFMGSQRQFHVTTGDGASWDILDPLTFETACVGDKVNLFIDPAQVLLLPRS
jgi:iron(III) transport system ATP-binding protein